MAEHIEPAERTPQKCYVLGKITFLPHYTMPSWYVEPGMKLNHLTHDELVNTLHTEADLKAAGAQMIYLPLWHRPSIDLKGV